MAILHAVEPNWLKHLVRTLLRHFHSIAQCGDTKHAATIGNDLAVLLSRARVKHARLGGRPNVLRQPCDFIAFARRVGITACTKTSMT